MHLQLGKLELKIVELLLDTKEDVDVTNASKHKGIVGIGMIEKQNRLRGC